jgi:hypothetical protein
MPSSAPRTLTIVLLAAAAAVPAVADTQFRIRQMTRDDVPYGKGQCDIRLQVDGEVEASVRGDSVYIHTLRGQDARDDGSECNMPLPRRDIAALNFEVKDSRNEIRLVQRPDRRSDYAAVVYIRDSSSGFGRYHFRISWDALATETRGGGPPERRRDFNDRPPEDSRGGFAWNNVVNFRGEGRGSAVYNDNDLRQLRDVRVDIDRGGRIQVAFRADRGGAVVFNGAVVAREGGRLKADVSSENGRLRGPMWLSVDDRFQTVSRVTLEASDGRDRVRINWDRR